MITKDRCKERPKNHKYCDHFIVGSKIFFSRWVIFT